MTPTLRTGPFVIGLDLGTSACKAVLADGSGVIAAETRAPYATRSPRPGWTEQDPADWRAAAADAVRRLIRDPAPGAVAGLALTSAAHIGVLVDERDEPVRPAILWNDQRSGDEVAALEREAGEEILAASFQAASTGWTLAHLRWIRRHDPSAWAAKRRLLLSKDWLLLWLTGERATDPATALSAQLADARTGCWSPRLCALADLDPATLPPILDARSVAGLLRPAAAAVLGLPAGLPVVNGTLDSATELLAAGLENPGDSLVRLATAGGVERLTASPGPHRRRITYPFPLSHLWYCQAGTSTCAAAVQWGMALFGETDFTKWDAEAASAEAGAEGLLFHPYLAGERAPLWNPAIRGSFTGLSLRHGRAHLARALYEGASFSIRHALGLLDDLPASPNPPAVAGGGSRSALWLSILADVLGRELRVPEGADSALGAARIGLEALGLRSGPWLTPANRERFVRPDPRRQALYEERYQAYVAYAALVSSVGVPLR